MLDRILDYRFRNGGLVADIHGTCDTDNRAYVNGRYARERDKGRCAIGKGGGSRETCGDIRGQAFDKE